MYAGGSLVGPRRLFMGGLITALAVLHLLAGNARAGHCSVLDLTCQQEGHPSDPQAAPDPGGDESALAPLPPPRGKYFAFNEHSFEAPYHGASASDVARIARGAGANAQRFTVDWWQVERRRGVWNERAWGRFQRMYAALVRRRMKPIIIVGFTPPWARDPRFRWCGTQRGCEYPPARNMNGEWARYVKEVTKRFPAAAIEVWNEPNFDSFWKPRPDPQRFAELQRIAYRAVKRINPRAIVLAGGLSNNQTPSGGSPSSPARMPLREFLDRAYRATPSIKHHMDAISFHPYAQQELDFSANTLFAKSFADIRDVKAAHGDASRRIWVTETGLTTSGRRALTEPQQAAGLLRQYRRVLTMDDVDAVTIHTLLDRVETSPHSDDHGYGLVRSVHPFVPKASYCAFAGRVNRRTPFGGCPRIVEGPPAGTVPGEANSPPAAGSPGATLQQLKRRARRVCKRRLRQRARWRRAAPSRRARMMKRCVRRYVKRHRRTEARPGGLREEIELRRR